MGIIDPKENLISIILTDKGKENLSKGKLNIKYFSFGDDEVDYQVKSGFSLGLEGFLPSYLEGLRLWVRADLGITLNGSNVAAWADQSGLGHHLIQATDTRQPAYSTNSLNGKPGVSFDGIDNCVRNASLAMASSNKITIALVLKDTAPNICCISMMGDGTVPGNGVAIFTNTVAAGDFELRSQGSDFTENGCRITEALTNPRRMLGQVDRAITGAPGVREGRIWRDGVEESTTQVAINNTPGNFADLPFNLGATGNGTVLPWQGVVYELAIYNRLLSDTEISRLDGYMKSFWEL